MDPSLINFSDAVVDEPSHSSINNNSATTDPNQIPLADSVEKSQTNHTEETVAELRKAVKEIKSTSSFTICRVPQELRKLKKSAYTPSLISIGPVHSKDEHLKPLGQNIKMSYANTLLSHLSHRFNEDARGMLNEFLKDMGSSIEKAKKYYAEEVPTLSAKMLVIDGCFILELLYRVYIDKKKLEETSQADSSGSRNQNPDDEKKSNDPIFSIPQRCVAVKHDLLLLENQLPFFVLEKLFRLTLGRISDLPELPDLVLKYFSKKLTIGCKPSNSNATKNSCWPPSNCVLPYFRKMLSIGRKCGDSIPTNCCRPPSDCILSLDPPSPKKHRDYHHILHLLHDHYIGSNSLNEGKFECMPSASDLDYAGVKFVALTGGQNLFNIEFNPTTTRPLFPCCRRIRFKIPSLRLDDSTEPFLRNLIAFERCCPRVSGYFTSYAAFMDTLINTEKDVEVLEKAKVISNHLGTRGNASRLFNNLCKEVPVDTEKGFHFVKACEDAANYSQTWWCSRAIPATTAYVIRKYSASPWTFKAFVIAFITFLISITNFIRSLDG